MLNIGKIIAIVLILVIYFSNSGLSIDKDPAKEYLSKLNTVLINVQNTSRNLSQRLILLEGAIMQMEGYIEKVALLNPPDEISRLHKMILLSLKKLRMGFYLLSKGHRDASIKVVNSGRDLLRKSAKDILEFSRKMGYINKL